MGSIGYGSVPYSTCSLLVTLTPCRVLIEMLAITYWAQITVIRAGGGGRWRGLSVGGMGFRGGREAQRGGGGTGSLRFWDFDRF